MTEIIYNLECEEETEEEVREEVREETEEEVRQEDNITLLSNGSALVNSTALSSHTKLTVLSDKHHQDMSSPATHSERTR